jgi:hypothetical protein
LVNKDEEAEVSSKISTAKDLKNDALASSEYDEEYDEEVVIISSKKPRLMTTTASSDDGVQFFRPSIAMNFLFNPPDQAERKKLCSVWELNYGWCIIDLISVGRPQFSV